MDERELLRHTVNKARNEMDRIGWRPVQETDLVPGKRMAMIEIEQWYKHSRMRGEIGKTPGTTIIQLAPEPLKKVFAEKSSATCVMFLCVQPENSQEFGIPKHEFLADVFQYRNVETNKVRFYVQK